MISTQMANHLLSQLCKKSFPPGKIPISISVHDGEDSFDLLLDLLLMAFQFWCLRSCGGDIFRDIFDVMVPIQNIFDFREISLKNREGIAVTVLDYCSDVDVLGF